MKMPNSIRKYIREEKSRIRREFLSAKEQKEKIDKLYQGFSRTDIKKEVSAEEKKETK
jgi:hypothetical protein